MMAVGDFGIRLEGSGHALDRGLDGDPLVVPDLAFAACYTRCSLKMVIVIFMCMVW